MSEHKCSLGSPQYTSPLSPKANSEVLKQTARNMLTLDQCSCVEILSGFVSNKYESTFFSNFNKHKNHLEVSEPAFLTNSQVTLMLLVRGLHFEYQCSGAGVVKLGSTLQFSGASYKC